MGGAALCQMQGEEVGILLYVSGILWLVDTGSVKRHRVPEFKSAAIHARILFRFGGLR